MAKESTTDISFPPLESALDDPNGLLAMGGELSRSRLIEAYSAGVFPWYDDDQPILWWSPNPRAVIEPDQVHISRSLKKNMRRCNYQLSVDKAFEQVIDACAEARKVKADSEETDSDDENDNQGTWITTEMKDAYIDLHHAGYAHSFEVWDKGKLVGGLYGIAIDKVFSGESMFHRQTDASKIAFVFACKQLQCWGFGLLDCQILNPHLQSLGVTELAREDFKKWLPAYKKTQNANTAINNKDTFQPMDGNWTDTHWTDTQTLLSDIYNA
jgi:leucyl/phenylalanyl-tRNA--protein transferase